MATSRWRIAPARAVEGGRVTVETDRPAFATDRVPSVLVGGVPAHVAAASARRLTLVVPPGLDGGRLKVTVDGVDGPVGAVEIGAPIATGLHQVDSPAFDAAGNLYVTYSGTRGQEVPVSVFRVRPDGAREVYATGIVNATSLAFDPFGDLCVSSRYDGTVLRVKADGSIEKVASDLGVACGLAFAADGAMFVGDRTGTLFRVNAAGKVVPFAMLPPSIAAFHVAVGRDEAVYVSGPTLATCDPIRRVDRRGEVSVFAGGFGRPQGLAVDEGGFLYVAEALAGASGIYRVLPGQHRELVVAGAGLIGLAFHPERGAAVASGDTVYLFEQV
jgi:hypothetical protein